MAATGGPESLLNQIPEGLKDVIGRRLTGLSEECNRVLSVAAVIGRDFAVDVLRLVGGSSEEELLTALEEAMRVSLIEEMKGGREVRYRFTHAFFRQTLYEEMIAPRRLRMHNEVAKALEAHYDAHLQEHAAELAEHFSHSSTEEDLEKAVQYGELAAERAASVYAFGEAARLLEQAIEVQEILDPKDGRAKLGLLAQLNATLLAAGEPDRVLNDIGPMACDLAESLDEGTIAAHVAEAAAYALIERDGILTFTNPLYKQWCERIRKNAVAGSREQVMGDGLLSWSYWTLRQPEKCWELRRNALDLARTVDDPEALAYAGFCFMAIGAPAGFLEERIQLAQELKDIPSTTLSPYLRAQYLYTFGQFLFQLCDVEAGFKQLDELDELAARVPDPYVQSWQMIGSVLRLTWRGEPEGAVELAEAFAAGARGTGIEVWGLMLSKIVTTASFNNLGRHDEMAMTYPFWRAFPYGDSIAMFCMADSGQTEAAHKELVRLMSQLRVGEEDSWVDDSSLCGMLATAALTGDKDAVATLYPLVEGTAEMHQLNYGVGARHLAAASVLMGDIAAARGNLDKALRVAMATDRAEVARVRLAMARLLFEHFPDEREAAAEHLNFATNEAQAMKMKPLLEECLALKLKFQGITSTDMMNSIDTVARVVMQDKPDLRPQAAPDGTVTVMFSDIEGSTALNDRLGDARFMEVLREHNAIVRDGIKAHSGFEVKSEGDGFMVAFQSAGKAVECAAAIQTALAERNTSTEEPVSVRMGLHAGEVIKEGEDFFGRNVIMAARVAAQARGGEVLASAVVKALLAGSDVKWGEARAVELKGLSGEHEIWAVKWLR